MKTISNITSDPKQTLHLVLDDASVVDFTLIYRGAIQRWSYDITYGTREIKGGIVCNHPNFLRKWRKVLPFGIACSVVDGTEPISQDDFSEGRAVIYLLNQDDITYVEDSIIGA
jgi:hypothetical protein